jgi:hypothetical protein
MPPVLTLICPTLFAELNGIHARGEALSPWPGLQRWLERGTARAIDRTTDTRLESWQFQLLDTLGLNSNHEAYASAPVSWLGEGCAYRNGTCFHAQPVHLVAGMNHVQLVDQVALSCEESQAVYPCVAALNTSDSEFTMSAQGRWYWWTQHALCVETVSPLHAAESRLDEAMPSGQDGRALRALMSEVQMALHDHPVNRARERRERLPANAVWLWGQGSMVEEAPRILPRIRADDVYARGLARLHGSPWEPLCANGVELSRGLQQDTIAVVGFADLNELEHRWIAPLMNERHDNTVCKLLLPGWNIRAPRNSWTSRLQRRRAFEGFLH